VLPVSQPAIPAGDLRRTVRWARLIEKTLAVVVITLCIWPAMGTSLWLDEAGTWWIVRDGIREAVSRALFWSASSPFYYAALWFAVQVLGLSEIALRLPSVIFSLATSIVLYRLARRWFDAEGALVTVVLFFCIPAVEFTVVDARPYALGLLLLVSTWLSMMRWLESTQWSRGVVFVGCAASVVWVHYTLVAGLIPLLWYAGRLGWRRSAAAAAAIVVLVLPLVAQILDTMDRREVLSWAAPPTVLRLTLSAGIVFLAPLVVFWAAALPSHPSRARHVPGQDKETLAPVMTLALLPPMLTFVISSLGIMQLFVPRYIVSKEVGLALVAAWLVMRIPHARLRPVALVTQVVLMLALNWPQLMHHGGEDWRASSAWCGRRSRLIPRRKSFWSAGLSNRCKPCISKTRDFATFCWPLKRCIPSPERRSCCLGI
jgi:hypothetical protein